MEIWLFHLTIQYEKEQESYFNPGRFIHTHVWNMGFQLNIIIFVLWRTKICVVWLAIVALFYASCLLVPSLLCKYLSNLLPPCIGHWSAGTGMTLEVLSLLLPFSTFYPWVQTLVHQIFFPWWTLNLQLECHNKKKKPEGDIQWVLLTSK